MEVFFNVMATIGGVGAIVFGLSKFLGGIWRDRIRIREEANLSREQIQPQSYLKTQFDVYIELWKVLQAFHITVDALWENATEENIRSLVEQLETINQKVNEWSVLICEEHLEKLRKLFDTLGHFHIGKARLYHLRHESDLIDKYAVQDINHQIKHNGELREQFKSLMEDIRVTFSKRLSEGKGDVT